MPAVSPVEEETNFLRQLQKSCRECALNSLCLPAGVTQDDLDSLEAAIRTKRTIERAGYVYRHGDQMHALYVLRSGAAKMLIEDADGEQQIVSFLLPGDVAGLGGFATGWHVTQCVALDRTTVCELPCAQLERVALTAPALQKQLVRVISRKIVDDYDHVMALGRHQAQERITIFLNSLSARYQRLGRNPHAIQLPMSRSDIANYLGLVLETVGRQFKQLEEMGVIEVKQRSVSIRQPQVLIALGMGQYSMGECPEAPAAQAGHSACG